MLYDLGDLHLLKIGVKRRRIFIYWENAGYLFSRSGVDDLIPCLSKSTELADILKTDFADFNLQCHQFTPPFSFISIIALLATILPHIYVEL